MYYIFLISFSLFQYRLSSGQLFYLRYIFSVITKVNVSLLWLLLACNIFFHLFTFNLFVTLYLKGVSFRQNMVRFLKFVFMPSDNLCLEWEVSGLQIIYSLSLCLSGNVLIFLLFLKNIFARYRIISWQLYSFSTENILVHCLLVNKISSAKSAVSLMEDTLFVMSYFSLPDF